MMVHPSTQQIFLSVERGCGTDTVPAIVKVWRNATTRVSFFAARFTLLDHFPPYGWWNQYPAIKSRNKFKRFDLRRSSPNESVVRNH
jgi:hypothetical protein